MWGMGSNSNNASFNRDDAEHQQQMAAAAAAQMAQLAEHQAAQQQINYNNNGGDYYNNVNPYQAAYHRQDMAASNAMLEERRRVEMALAANALQEQEAAHLRQAQIQAAYDREVATLAANEQLAGMRRNMIAQELAGAVRDLGVQSNSSNSMINQRSQMDYLGETVRQELMRSNSASSSNNAEGHDSAVQSVQRVSSPCPSMSGSRAGTTMDSLATATFDNDAQTPPEEESFTPPPDENTEPVEEPVEVKPKEEEEPIRPPTPPASSPPKQKKKKATPSSSAKRTTKKTPSKRTPKKTEVPQLIFGSLPALRETVPEITEDEYVNLDLLMDQFCKVPLLAEFSRPVSLLHPELTPLYKKVVQNPIDLGRVCRAIRRRQYTNTRQVCIDVWRIFSNCVKYHTHPITREGAIPSFISIANHLREYFNALWMEYMIPSEIPKAENEKDPITVALQHSDEKRTEIRAERENSVTAVVLSSKLIEKASDAMVSFVQMEGRVDALDKTSILEGLDDEGESEAVNGVFQALSGMATRLREIAHSEYEYTVESLNNDLKRCYGDEIFDGYPWLKVKFAKRFDRMIGKLTVPINEVSCRGVNQSSVWGCMAAAIWARENTKKPYWPALVLGIMAPDDQREDWHVNLTLRNETRLPEKLRTGLQTGKKKSLQAIQRQNEGKAERMSYFLVEFLGTHEFIWVREADIVENFDPEEDVNQQMASVGNITKKKKTSLRGQTAANARMLQKATDEGRWALEEFEIVLNDPCGDQMEDMIDDEEEDNYSFAVLCESDDEADEVDSGSNKKSKSSSDVYESPTGLITSIDEINELIATDGKVDYSSEGRKVAKKRAAALKKKLAAEAKKSVQKKEKKTKPPKSSSKSDKGKGKGKQQSDAEFKKELKELEKRRKKRGRERDRVLKESERKAKKMKVDGNSTMIRRGRKLGIADKRGRATRLVRGYLNTVATRDNLKGLGLGGVSTLPAANVDGSGLLGLALAFRAAAGEVNMPNTDDNPSSVKPWDHIDVDGPLISEERCENLENQIKLLESALVKLDAVDERRRKLIEKAEEDKIAYDEALHSSEKDARQNDMPKRKVSVKRKISVDKSEVKKEEDAGEDEAAGKEDASDVKKKDASNKNANEEVDDEHSEDGVEAEAVEEDAEAGDNKHDSVEMNVKTEASEDGAEAEAMEDDVEAEAMEDE
jgi:hypothetical protein